MKLMAAWPLDQMSLETLDDRGARTSSKRMAMGRSASGRSASGREGGGGCEGSGGREGGSRVSRLREAARWSMRRGWRQSSGRALLQRAMIATPRAAERERAELMEQQPTEAHCAAAAAEEEGSLSSPPARSHLAAEDEGSFSSPPARSYLGGTKDVHPSSPQKRPASRLVLHNAQEDAEFAVQMSAEDAERVHSLLTRLSYNARARTRLASVTTPVVAPTAPTVGHAQPDTGMVASSSASYPCTSTTDVESNTCGSSVEGSVEGSSTGGGGSVGGGASMGHDSSVQCSCSLEAPREPVERVRESLYSLSADSLSESHIERPTSAGS